MASKGKDRLELKTFDLLDRGKKLTSYAPLALRTTLKAYFSSQLVCKHYHGGMNWEGKEVDGLFVPYGAYHSADYCELATEAIVHATQFLEVTCKKLLKDLYSFDDAALRKLNGVAKAHAVLATKLQREPTQSSVQYAFLGTAHRHIQVLSELRNPNIHSGVRIVTYSSLDDLFVTHVLPLVKDLMSTDVMRDLDYFWKYAQPACGIDPITEIVAVAPKIETGRVDRSILIFLKEIGRAAYINPLRTASTDADRQIVEYVNRPFKRRAEKLTESEECEPGVRDVKLCPVCGSNTLLRYDECNDFDEDPYWYIHSVWCATCEFQLSNDISNPREYGYGSIPDFWEASN